MTTTTTRPAHGPARIAFDRIADVVAADPAAAGPAIDALATVLRRWNANVVADHVDEISAEIASVGERRAERILRWLSRHADDRTAQAIWARAADGILASA